MQLKCTPFITPRYWGAMILASMCGANLGDFFPDILRMDRQVELVLLAALSAAILAIDKLLPRGSEFLYWLTIIVVRAAATAIADFSRAVLKVDAAIAGIALAAVLVMSLTFEKPGAKSNSCERLNVPPKASKPAADLHYWTTMLIAGTLGTVMGDGFGHAFGPLDVGYPVSTLLATVALVAMFGLRARMSWSLGASYWVTIVAVRWWGTVAGDIFSFLTALLISMTVTAVAMTAVLIALPNQRAALAAGRGQGSASLPRPSDSGRTKVGGRSGVTTSAVPPD